MLFEICLAVVVVLFLASLKTLVQRWRTYCRQYEAVRNVPGPACLPLLGCLHKLPKVEEIMSFILRECALADEKGSPMLRLWFGWDLTLLLVSPNAFRAVLTDNELLAKGRDYEFFQRWLGLGILVGAGERWRKTRKMITPTFHFVKVEEYAQTIDYHVRILVDILKREAEKGELDLYARVKMCTLDIICDTSMGKELDSQNNPDQPYVKAVQMFNFLGVLRSFSIPFLLDLRWQIQGQERLVQSCLKTLKEFTQKVIEERVQALAEEKDFHVGEERKRPNFLDLILKMNDQNQISMEHLREEVDTLMFAGHDTVTHAVSWAVWALATHPDCQQRLYDELVENFGLSDSEFASSKLKDLPYLERCLKEAMRLFPPVPVIQRYAEKDMELEGCTVPAGVSLNLPIIWLHRNPKIYPNPTAFDPDRFADGTDYPPFTYVPFSAGPRNCIGQKFAIREAKIMLAHLVYNFEISTDRKFDANRPLVEVILRPANGCLVRLKPRTV